jgi:hypothetical protein
MRTASLAGSDFPPQALQRAESGGTVLTRDYADIFATAVKDILGDICSRL